MHKLSTGQDSTLGNYLILCRAAFGDNSHATENIRKKITNSPRGEAEEVLADETQMINMLASLALKDKVRK